MPSVTVAAAVPAGLYQITATSSDVGHVAGRQTDQTSERWSFVTDTGVSSPIVPDLPDAQTSSTFGMGQITFDDPVSSITFVHHGTGLSADSVSPTLLLECVAPATTSSTTDAPTTSAVVQATTTVPGSVAPTSLVATTSTTSAAVQATTSAAPSTSAPPVTVGAEIDPDPTNQVGDTLPRTGLGEWILWSAAVLLVGGVAFVVVGRDLVFRLAPTNAFRVQPAEDPTFRVSRRR